jgi:ABC-type nitrate/sulfonate/bicarbonate transport system permease component
VRGRGYEAVKIAAEIAVPIAIVVIWELWARSADSQFWPPPSKIVQEFVDLWVFEQFRSDVVPSLLRILLGFGIGSAIGVVLGVTRGM